MNNHTHQDDVQTGQTPGNTSTPHGTSTTTPNGTNIPIIYKDGLLNIQHYYPANKQMKEITREEIMTSHGTWNPSLIEDSPLTLCKRDSDKSLLHQLNLRIVSITWKVTLLSRKQIQTIIQTSITIQVLAVTVDDGLTDQELERRNPAGKTVPEW